MKESKLVCSFYKYAKIEEPVKFQQEQLELCKSLSLKGRILLGEEGINGSVYGAKGSIEKYKKELKKNNLFAGIQFKEQETEKTAFRKIFVRIRKEIVHSGMNVDLKNTGKFISPKKFKEILDDEEDAVLVDMRNDYESRIGKFKNAVALKIKNFREFPTAINQIGHLKNKKIIAYCTGGIRCEKASAYLKENGFGNVMQLEGGILSFGQEFPDTYWEGKCFVFDDRLAIDLNKNNIALNQCTWCSAKCDDYSNCHNLNCDKLFICCEECVEKHNKSCSEECSEAPKRRKEFALVEA